MFRHREGKRMFKKCFQVLLVSKLTVILAETVIAGTKCDISFAW